MKTLREMSDQIFTILENSENVEVAEMLKVLEESMVTMRGAQARLMAYASEFDTIDEDGEYDIGSIHQNIRKLKKNSTNG